MTKGGLTTETGVCEVAKKSEGKKKSICKIEDVLAQQGRMKKWLCKETGINPGWLTRLASGESLPNAHHAQRIAEALGVSIGELWPLPPKKEDTENGENNT